MNFWLHSNKKWIRMQILENQGKEGWVQESVGKHRAVCLAQPWVRSPGDVPLWLRGLASPWAPGHFSGLLPFKRIAEVLWGESSTIQTNQPESKARNNSRKLESGQKKKSHLIKHTLLTQKSKVPLRVKGRPAGESQWCLRVYNFSCIWLLASSRLWKLCT